MVNFAGFSNRSFQFPGSGKNTKDRTALHLAVLDNDAAQLEFLLAHNASPNARDAQGHTPFHYAIAHKDLQVAQRLLKAGADVNVRDWKRRTILTILSSPKLAQLNICPDGSGFEERIRFLRQQGATT